MIIKYLYLLFCIFVKKYGPKLGAGHSNNYKYEVIKNLTNKITQKEFINESRLSEGAFLRNRLLPFNELIFFILQKESHSLSIELENYFQARIGSVAPSASSFTQARSHLKPEVFKKLNKQSTDIFYQNCSFKTWKGHKVLSIDGSRAQLPFHPTIKDRFGIQNFGKTDERFVSIGSFSMLYDALNGVVLNSELEGYDTSENEMGYRHLDFVSENDILLYDGLYCNKYLLFKLMKEKRHFCFKMSSRWKIIQEFIQSGKDQELVTIQYSKKGGKPKEEGFANQITVRLVKKKKKNNEVVVYCTSLMDEEKYSVTSIAELYKLRWGIEECYKLFKCRMTFENFSGKTATAVLQEFHAKTFLITLTGILCSDLPLKVTTKTTRTVKHNKTIAVYQIKKMIVKLKKVNIMKLLDLFIARVSNCYQYSRSAQSTKRKFKPYMNYSMNYKTV
jgi:hypothetical protein